MSATLPMLLADTGQGERAFTLAAYVDGPAAETAEEDAIRWIKSLRTLDVDGVSLRDRFTYRGDSLWWFAELFLHKREVIARLFRTIAAFERFVAQESPQTLRLEGIDPLAAALAPQVAARHGVKFLGPALHDLNAVQSRLARSFDGVFHTAAAVADRLRPSTWRAPGSRDVDVVAFVHAAFWRADAGEETYIGSVLEDLAERLPKGGLRLIGVGPRTNFRARSWRQRLAEFRDPHARHLPFTPVEVFATWRSIRESSTIWRARGAVLASLVSSPALRDASIINGYDAWPIVKGELAGIAALQFPWSARTMDEAAAVLDALRPRTVVTYAEAGGWGRAIVLEARRRQIPVVGLQHGFIYRHWLNYRHELDEMAPSPANLMDRGFPRPDLTLVFDDLTARHLVDAGRFPRDAIIVTGSPRLDRFWDTARHLTEADLAAIRQQVGVGAGQHLVVLATKFTQVAPAFPALVRAVAAMPDVKLVVKCHPAETPEAYERAASLAAPGKPAKSPANVAIAPASADLARLTAAARLIVTVNSTAAIEAMIVDVPALVVALPNNLSPFVDARAMAGASSEEEVETGLRALLYDEEVRARLALGRQAFMTRWGIGADGQSARRAADTLITLSMPAETRAPSASRSTPSLPPDRKDSLR